MFTNASMLKWRERTGGRGGRGVIIRLNDKKEQCCDSEQLVFPSVDRPCCCVCVCVCVYMCACAPDGDRLSCDCSFLSRALLIGVIDGICGGKEKHDKWHSTKCPTSFPPSRYFLLIQCRGLKVNMFGLLANCRRG